MTAVRRRFLLQAALAVGLSAGLRAQELPVPRHKVSARELHRALSARFPVRLEVGGLLGVQVSAPALLLAPQRNRLGATLLAQASGLAGAAPPGEIDLVFALRYEARDRSLRAVDSELLALRWPGLPEEFTRALRDAWPELARPALGEIVLHQFSQQELALPETMGLQPASFQVVQDGLVVGFAAAPR